MHTVRSHVALLVALFASVLLRDASGLALRRAEIVGAWEGRITVQSMTLRIGFLVTRGTNGALQSTMDSIDQGLKAIPVDETTCDAASVRFVVRKFGIEYSGQLDGAGSKIAGEFKQGGAAVPLELKRTERLADLARPQTPKPPFPYQSEDVDYDSLNDSISLGGTLFIPNGEGMKPPFPAVVLITGSGQQDRDESLLGHKPFLVLADHLARHGIAVLRADDRGIGGSTGRFESSTSFDFADDALGGVAFLKSRPEIDTKRIGLIGHSEGGLIAPICATKSADVGFIVLLAGTGVSGREISIEQGRLISLANGKPKDQVEIEAKLSAAMIDLAISVPVGPELGAKLDELLKRGLEKSPPGEKWIYEDAAQTAREINSPWFKAFFAIDPQEYLVQVKCPVLALNGAKDLQVPATMNIPAIEAALRKGGNTHTTARILPDLNHLFQKSTTGAPSEYAVIETTMEESVMDLVTEWIRGV